MYYNGQPSPAKAMDVIDAQERAEFVQSKLDMVVTGGAGTAKTTACLQKAQATPDKRFCWLTFAKEPATETMARADQMGLVNFEAATIHSLAHRLLYLNRGIDPGDPATLAEIESYKETLAVGVAEKIHDYLTSTGDQPSMQKVGFLCPHLDANRRWRDPNDNPDCNNISDDVVEIVYENYDLDGVFGCDADALEANGYGALVDLLNYTRLTILNDVKSGSHYSFFWSVECVIDMNLHQSLCRLESPQSGYDCLMFDEAQDLSVDLFRMVPTSKHIQKIFLGEGAQSIYRFRTDCFNVFEDPSVESYKHLHFCQSFRCSQETIDYATTVCKDTDLEIDMIGNPNIHTEIIKDASSYTLDPSVTYIFLGREWVHCLGFLTSIQRSSNFPNDFSFRFLGQDTAEHATLWLDERMPESTEYKLLIQKWIADGRYASYAEADTCSFALGTVHSSKGLSIENVILSDCLINNVRNGGDGTESDDPNLAYVAITRSINRLILSSSIQR